MIRTSQEALITCKGNTTLATRYQSGVVPYRINKKGEVEILLISKADGGWSMTKGGIAKNHTPITSAQKEAFEEAGIKGLVEAYLGSMQYTKRGDRQSVQWYLMLVTKEKKTWDEDYLRDRKWMKPEKAIRKIDPKYARIIELALTRIGSVKH